MNRYRYDFHGAAAWETVYRKKFSELPHTCANVFLIGLPNLERKQNGLCGTVTANYQEIARASFVSANTVGKILDAGAGVCIEVKIGQSVIGGAATQIRRLTITEMENPRERKGRFRLHTPPLAEDIAERLRGRTIPYKGGLVQPRFEPCKTGRIYTSRPNIQGDGQRLAHLLAGLSDEDWIIEVDYRAAEPTVLRHVLRATGFFKDNWPDNPYQLLASLRGVPYDEAKRHFLASFYAPNTRAVFSGMNLATHSFFGELANAIEAYKEDLWAKGKPAPKVGLRRHVRTLGGTLIEALTGERVHHGKLLAWQIQGTVADIINRAMDELLKREALDNWRVICPVHDSVIVTAKRYCAPQIEEIMQRHARDFGIVLQTKQDARPKIATV